MPKLIPAISITAQGKSPASRVDAQLSGGPNGQIFVLKETDGVIHRMTK